MYLLALLRVFFPCNAEFLNAIECVFVMAPAFHSLKLVLHSDTV